jgi:hypothetical protein
MMQNKMTAPPLQGISNLMKMQGRMGDTELVHMTKPEVKGLASLGVLTKNPNTGLPEAFLGSVGGFFRDWIVPGALAAIPGAGPVAGLGLGPTLAAGYQMAKTGAMGGNFIDAATAGLLSVAGTKLGEKLGSAVGGMGDVVGGTGASTGTDATTQAMTETIMGEAVPSGLGGVPITPDIAGKSASQLLKEGATRIPNTAAARTGELFSGAAPSIGERLGDFASAMIPKTPEAIGGMGGRALASATADAMLQEKLQSQAIPEQVKDAETAQQEFSTGKLQNMNPQYADKDLSASRIVGAMQGTQAPLQFTDPSYSPAVTGNLSSILGAKDGGAMSNLKERAMGTKSKGLADALESITEGAEDIVDMGGGQVYFEGMVKGDGDGMSDEIPFSIEGQQPALLSRDEYVLPADVVSALGNGSSNAGADMLDKFMTDVREKTMGRERQINQIG